jgi:predicted histidine transporter YuiF (NhaC family)
MAAPSLCGGAVKSRRGLLASLWSFVVCLASLAFIVALIFTLSAENSEDLYYNNSYNNNNNEGDNNAQANQMEAEMAVTSRAMAFAATWTAVLATLMAIFGAVVLGWQSPTGVYYTCCSPQVHRTTPLALGSFIGALLMFANLTLVCSVLFGEFDVSLSWFEFCAL